jgi:hypothetical protein
LPSNVLYSFVLSPIRATRPTYRIFLDFIILIIFGEEYKLWSSSLGSFIQPPFTSSLFGPNILLSPLFSSKLSLCSSLNVGDQVSHPYRTKEKNIILYKYYSNSISSLIKFYFVNSRSKISKLCLIFETSVTYLYVTILPCILVMRQQHILSLLCAYYQTNLLAGVN